jgi:hypothetical protein
MPYVLRVQTKYKATGKSLSTDSGKCALFRWNTDFDQRADGAAGVLSPAGLRLNWLVRRCHCWAVAGVSDGERHLYQAPHLIENFIALLVQYRVIAMRHDKTAQTSVPLIWAPLSFGSIDDTPYTNPMS